MGSDTISVANTILNAGLRIGSIDLPEWKTIIAADPGVRAEIIAKIVLTSARAQITVQ